MYYGQYSNSGIKSVIRWDNMPFTVRSKWHWYFRYREALEIVRNPRCLVEMKSGSEEEQLTEEEKRKRQTTRIKAQLTKNENKLEAIRTALETDASLKDMFGYTPLAEKVLQARSETILKINQLKKELDNV